MLIPSATLVLNYSKIKPVSKEVFPGNAFIFAFYSKFGHVINYVHNSIHLSVFLFVFDD